MHGRMELRAHEPGADRRLQPLGRVVVVGVDVAANADGAVADEAGLAGAFAADVAENFSPAQHYDIRDYLFKIFIAFSFFSGNVLTVRFIYNFREIIRNIKRNPLEPT